MPDVFISYKSERRAAARHLARVLELHGYDVWFDYKLLSGADFARQIDQKLRAAKAVVTLWCSQSVDSEWVLEEAHVAKERGVIVPVWIEKADLPLGFTRLDTIDLAPWDGGPRSHALDRLFDQIAGRAGKQPQPNYQGLKTYEEDWRGFGAPTLAQFALSAGVERGQGAGTPPPQHPSPGSTPGQTEPPQQSEDMFGDAFGDVFKDIFGDKNAKSDGAKRGSDLKYETDITLEDAFSGKRIQVTVPGNKTLEVDIPAGISDGNRVRLSGEGERGVNGGDNGDLYIFVSVASHPIFDRDGADLSTHLRVAQKIMDKGGACDLSSIDGGAFRLTIPKKSSYGQKLRVRGKGMSQLKGSGNARGDLYVKLAPEA